MMPAGMDGMAGMAMAPPVATGRGPRARLRHVGGDDAGDDAAERGADDPDLRRGQPRRGSAASPTCRRCCSRRLSPGLGSFSVVATLAQWALEQASLVSPMAMESTSPLLGGMLFVAAGIYQFTPLKQRLPASLPLALRFRRQPLARRLPARCGWGWRTGCTAWAAAGS